MLTVRCTLLRDVFEGGSHDSPRNPEWPPSWMRLFSALVAAAAEDDTADELLELLEAAAAPEIYASPILAPVYREAFVPTNATGKSSHGTLVGRINSTRGWARAVPRSPAVYYHWPDLDLSAGQRRTLHLLCQRIPYFGRSTSPAVVETLDDAPELTDRERWVPSVRVSDARAFQYRQTLRSPFPGALKSLRAAHVDQFVGGGVGYPWEIGVGIDYGTEEEPVPDEHRGPYRTMVVFALEGSSLDGRHTARVAAAFRRAALSRAERHLATLHGHHDGAVVQCAFLGLPFVGMPHADGHLLGMAVAIPDLSPEDLAVLHAALGPANRELRLACGPFGVLALRRLSPLEAESRPWTLRTSRWTGLRGNGESQATRAWASALPMVLDRYLHRSYDVETEIRRAVINSGFPAPDLVRFDERPLLRNGLDLAPRDTLRRPGDRGFRPYRHVHVVFPQPVRGPVVLGSMRHYGLGLCVPVESGNADD